MIIETKDNVDSVIFTIMNSFHNPDSDKIIELDKNVLHSMTAYELLQQLRQL